MNRSGCSGKVHSKQKKQFEQSNEAKKALHSQRETDTFVFRVGVRR